MKICTVGHRRKLLGAIATLCPYPASAPHVDLRPLGRAIVSGGVLKRGAASWQTSGYLYGVPAG
jgi:hypothetical protein